MEKNHQNNKIDFFSKIIKENNKNGDSDTFNKISSDENNDFWYIEIPSISLKAPVNSGVELDTLQRYVGHFKETSLDNGNIGLAAHNRRL